jgi:hypothetical protein
MSKEDMFADLDKKMKHNWRLRWYYRWAKLKLDISEWYYKHTSPKPQGWENHMSDNLERTGKIYDSPPPQENK